MATHEPWPARSQEGSCAAPAVGVRDRNLGAASQHARRSHHLRNLRRLRPARRWPSTRQGIRPACSRRVGLNTARGCAATGACTRKISAGGCQPQHPAQSAPKSNMGGYSCKASGATNLYLISFQLTAAAAPAARPPRLGASRPPAAGSVVKGIRHECCTLLAVGPDGTSRRWPTAEGLPTEPVRWKSFPPASAQRVTKPSQTK